MPVDSVPGSRPKVSRRKRRPTSVLRIRELLTKSLVRTSPEEGYNQADDVECKPCGSKVFRLNEYTLGSPRSFTSTIKSYYPTRTKYRGMLFY